MAKAHAFKPKEIDKTIVANMAKLRKPGVLMVRPGYEITGEQLTGKQAIVVTVDAKKKKTDLSPKNTLPERIGKYPVDVREASAYQRLCVSDPANAALVWNYERPEEREPEWPNEREVSSGKFFTARASAAQRALQTSAAVQSVATRALAAHASRKDDQIDYDPPNTAPALVPIKLKTTITAHVSPDAGFATLSKFLAKTQRSLKVAMYDFTSGPILAQFFGVLSGGKDLQMVLDNPAPNDTRDQLDGVTVEELESKLGQHAKIARALVRTDKFASKWMFPFAYHIKVLVQDGAVLWLSSGNLNNSNQPDLSRPQRKEDRDWHVIIESQELAEIFTAYLDYDYRSAIQQQEPDPGEVEKAIEDALAKKGELTNPPPSHSVPPVKNPVPAKVFKDIDVTITPLLTPDKLPGGHPQYLTNITKLLEQAEKSIYIQLQYIEASKGDGSAYEHLLKTIADKIAGGVEVKLIEDNRNGLKWVEKMKAAGVDLTDNIWLQFKDYSVHNKGFVIDSRIAVVSSQNFSPAGVETNRDAGVIIENEDIAKYFEAVFLSDFKTRTRQAVAASARSAKRAGAATKRSNGRAGRSTGKTPKKGTRRK